MLHLLTERLVDDRQEGAPGEHRDAHDQQLRSLRAPEMAEENAVHRDAAARPAAVGATAGASSPPGSRVLVQLEERLLEMGRLDRQVA